MFCFSEPILFMADNSEIKKGFFYSAKIKYFILNVIKIVNSSIREVITVFFYLFVFFKQVIKSRISFHKA
ncbi:hypothetical protein BOQ64_18990 [Chryseobacterium sp. CH25]|nr:hypothetical protein BOQ64_18990 [Chryseobacterium sp. CH25]RXM62615.1 hypothetical protein BOQ60_21230 [Chryseobacterium sp. CH1]